MTIVIGEKYRTGPNSKYNKEEWGFTAKEQGGGRWMKVTKRKYQESCGEGILSNHSLAEGRPGGHTSPGGL